MTASMMRTKGERVGAILGSKDGAVEFLGYGTYVGDEVPPENIGGFNFGNPNPKIELDNGKVVWGCECWWGPEDKIKATLQQYTDVRTVDIDDARAAAQPTVAHE